MSKVDLIIQKTCEDANVFIVHRDADDRACLIQSKDGVVDEIVTDDELLAIIDGIVEYRLCKAVGTEVQA